MAHDARPMNAAHARGGPRRGSPRALALQQQSPRFPSESHQSPNTISPSHRSSHLTPRPFPNSPAGTPSDSAHGGAAGGETARPRQPPEARAGPSVGLTFNYGPTAYIKQQHGAAGRARASCSDARPSAAAVQLPR